MRTSPLLLLLAGACATASPRESAEGRDDPRPRIVVTADPELDDSNSLVRYLLFSSDFRTEGLVYASSQFHWKGDGTGKTLARPNREYNRFGLNLCPCTSWRWAPDERFIDDAVDTYERVYPNLRVHDPRYPAPADLRSRIRWGNVEFDGDMSKDTDGSNLIRALLLDDEPGPLYLLAWGGQSTIARALKSIEDEYARTPRWAAIQATVSRKAIISASGDQDDTYASYIRPSWPGIRTLPAGRGGVGLGYGAAMGASADNVAYYTPEWTRANVSSVGPFGAMYRVWGDGRQMVKDDRFDFFGFAGQTAEQLRARGYVVWTPPRPQGEFLGEGDTFTFLNFVANGLDGWRDDTLGGWAGLGVPNSAGMTFGDFVASAEQLAAGTRGPDAGGRPATPDPNFTPAAQNAFAARLRWSISPRYADANHEPRVHVRESRLTARAGETVALHGAAFDPDGNAVRVRWWQWRDADTYPGRVTITNAASAEAWLQTPADAQPGQTIHLVLEATDDGTPALTRYARVVVTIR